VDSFADDEGGYRQWLTDHPDLFVLNTARPPTPTYLILHRASCYTINGNPPRGTRWTADYQKICGNRQELEHYANHHIGGRALPCRRCL
jgi:hypothetical protein